LDQALIHLKNAAALEPERGVWQLELGALTARQGDLQAARQFYQAAVALEPDNAQMWIEQARFSVSYNQDIRGLGLPSARTAYRLDPDDARVLDVIGTVFLSLGDAATAERFLQRALNQEPEFAAANLHLGQMFLIRGETQKAQDYLIRAAQLDPDGEIGRIAQRLMER
jgi:tetratricopeptide (TPR) repeat protein